MADHCETGRVLGERHKVRVTGFLPTVDPASTFIAETREQPRNDLLAAAEAGPEACRKATLVIVTECNPGSG
jgi:hypothetical protein